jgi:hypothetical protein
VVGETVSLLLSLPTIGKEEIPARVARQLGTQYGLSVYGPKPGTTGLHANCVKQAARNTLLRRAEHSPLE